jgi:hypothetical protein
LGAGDDGEGRSIDEIFVSIAPVLLGDGVRLLDRPGGTTVRPNASP